MNRGELMGTAKDVTGKGLSRRAILATGGIGLAMALTRATMRRAAAQEGAPPPPDTACLATGQPVESRSPELTGRPVERWQRTTVAGDAPRVATDGTTVFVSDNDRSLLALDLATGSVRWRVSLDGNGSIPVVVGDLVMVDDGERGLLALDAGSGNERWQFDARASFAAAAICGGQAVAGGEAGLFALDAGSGEARWSLLTGAPHGRPATDGELVVSQSADGVLYAVEAETGEERWSVPFGGSGSTPALGAGTVFAAVDRGRLGERHGTLTAFDAAAGSARWSRELAERLQGSPVVAGERVYLGVGGALVAFATASGDELWRTDAGSLLATPAVAGATVYVAAGSGGPVDGTGRLLALDTGTGAELWRVSLPFVMVAPPAVTTGLVVTGSADPYVGGAIVVFGE